MSDSERNDIRRMERGHWYWADKAIIRHYARSIGAVAVAVYDCLASFANADQTCYPSQQHIGDMLGCSRTTVNRAIKTLERHDLIAIEKSRSYPQVYRLLHVSYDAGAQQLLSTCTLPVSPAHTNKNKLTRYNNNKSHGTELIHKDSHSRSLDLHPAIQHEPLALQIANALNDARNLQTYLAYCRTYPESLLHRALHSTSAVPDHKIRTSRAALFKHLVKTYDKQSNHSPGD